MFHDVYRNKRILITGHNGFKGAWLCFWLKQLGAELCGYSLHEDREWLHFSRLNVPMQSVQGNVCNYPALKRIFDDFQPQFVFHLAAQPLVRESYRTPRETFAANFMGTVNVLDACRLTPSVEGAVIVTTDKCYANSASRRQAFSEEDPMGGADPYSASKGAAELAVASYRTSYDLNIASARAGNVIGGGDWACDRLIPDLVRAASDGNELLLRYPGAVRPWQHVLEALSGYLLLGEKLLTSGKAYASGWNFGPLDMEAHTVLDIIRMAQSQWNEVRYRVDAAQDHAPEAAYLTLNCARAENELQWRPVWNAESAVSHTINWYRAWYEKNELLTMSDWNDYISAAENAGLDWTL